MKFGKQKLKKCKDCIYYYNLGKLHFCTREAKIKYGFPILAPLKLICFKKEVN